ncbi:C2H2-type zinc finger protein [uncultured Endozoicomonas sp.]|uniref:C2H2-type zinc finger protein n=1 Tax=uncultured Endozoicomonas sp. TaxID=432652 RepID=UPI0026039536|nr:C2H2-type zinc finger protein [uncultured Endozoicomonas sp.]
MNTKSSICRSQSAGEYINKIATKLMEAQVKKSSYLTHKINIVAEDHLPSPTLKMDTVTNNSEINNQISIISSSTSMYVLEATACKKKMGKPEDITTSSNSSQNTRTLEPYHRPNHENPLFSHFILRSEETGNQDKKFLCKECKYSTNFYTNYKTHLRIHSGVKPYRCPRAECGKAFTQKANQNTRTLEPYHRPNHEKPLFSHFILRSEETGNQDKKFLCKECKYSTNFYTNYKTHLRIHSGVKPYRCPRAGCSKAFTQKANLHKHSQTHTTR